MSAPHVVLDADFGRGEHFLACWSAWRDGALAAGSDLHYLAVAVHAPEVAQLGSDALRAVWPLPVPGWHRIVLEDGRVTLDLMIAPLDVALPQIEARVNAFYLPASVVGGDDDKARATANTLARALGKLAAPGATLLACAPDEGHAWALQSAGFACEAVAGTADLRAVYAGRKPFPAAPPEPDRRAIVIGAGIAGSAVCERLCAHGWEVTLIERHGEPGQEASGNRAGIFMPLLSKDDNIPTRLSRAAYLFALGAWRRLGGVGAAFDGASCGVLQLARDAAHARVQQEVVAGWHYPPEYVRWLDAGAAGERLGCATPHGGWWFAQGGWARPASLCQAMLDACGARLQRRFLSEAVSLRRCPDAGADAGAGVGANVLWQVCGADGAVIAQAPTVVLASGKDAAALAQAAELPLTALRGQVTHLALAEGVPALDMVVCREAYVTPATAGIVSAGATYDGDGEAGLRQSSQDENLARLAEILPQARVAGAPLAGRVGFRCAAPDRLPLLGALPDYAAAGRLERLRDVPRHAGLYGALGYASRGLIWAPLMAELLVSQLEHRPAPLEASLAAALDPGRFLLKHRRRLQ